MEPQPADVWIETEQPTLKLLKFVLRHAHMDEKPQIYEVSASQRDQVGVFHFNRATSREFEVNIQREARPFNVDRMNAFNVGDFHAGRQVTFVDYSQVGISIV